MDLGINAGWNQGQFSRMDKIMADKRGVVFLGMPLTKMGIYMIFINWY